MYMLVYMKFPCKKVTQVWNAWEWVTQTYRESLQWRTDWCSQQCWWPHSCTVHYLGSGHLEFPNTVHQQWTEFDLPTERDRKGRIIWLWYVKVKVTNRSRKYTEQLACSLTSSLYHSISGGGSPSVWHSSVKWPLAGTDTVLTSLEPRRVGGTESDQTNDSPVMTVVLHEIFSVSNILLYILKFKLFLWWKSWIFSINTSLQSHMILQKYVHLVLKKHLSLLSMLKPVVLLDIFMELVIYILQDTLINRIIRIIIE